MLTHYSLYTVYRTECTLPKSIQIGKCVPYFKCKFKENEPVGLLPAPAVQHPE